MKLLWTLLFLGLSNVVRSFSISADASGGTMIVEALGSSKHQMTDGERIKFEIDEDKMLEYLNSDVDALRTYSLVSTDPVILQAFFPTFDPLVTALTAKKVEYSEGTANPTTMFSTIVTNPSSVPVEFDQAITKEESQTVSHEWSQSESFDVSQEISVSLSLGPLAAGSSTTEFSYSQEWGSTESVSQTVTLGTTYTVSFVLQPGQAVEIKLVSFKGTADIDVTYEAAIDGNVVVVQQPVPAFRRRGFQQLFGGSELDKVFEVTERISFEYFSKTFVEINDATPSGLRGEKSSNLGLGSEKRTPTFITPDGIPIFDNAGVLKLT